MYHLILLFLIFPWSWWGGRPHFVIQACRYERGGVRIRWSFSFWSLPTKNWWNSNIWKKTKDPPALWVGPWRFVLAGILFCSLGSRPNSYSSCNAMPGLFLWGGVTNNSWNWSCTSIEFRIVLVVGRFVFHCIRLWKRFSLSVQDLFYKKCAILFRVFLFFVLLFCCFQHFENLCDAVCNICASRKLQATLAAAEKQRIPINQNLNGRYKVWNGNREKPGSDLSCWLAVKQLPEVLPLPRRLTPFTPCAGVIFFAEKKKLRELRLAI